MGKRGVKTASQTYAQKNALERMEVIPWEVEGLSRVNRVIAFIESLPITSGVHAGRKFILRPWQKRIIRSIYKTRKGRRVIKTALITTPRKQGKTALAAALALCHLLGPEAEPRGQCYSAAADREQAAIIFREMVAIVYLMPEFSERCHVKALPREIIDNVTGSVYRALSADARKAHGLSPSFAIYDELAQARDRTLFDNLSSGTGARSEPLVIVISTQSPDPHHILSELVDYGQSVLDVTIEDESFHATIYAAPPDSDPWSVKTWRKCNPALGDFRSLGEFRQFAAQAKRMPSKENVFRNL